MNQVIDYHAILPELILSGTILVVLVVDVFLPDKRKSWSMAVALVGVVAALIATLTLVGDPRTTFGGAYVVDNFAILFKLFFLSVAVVLLAISLRYVKEGGFYQGEYYFLLLTSFLGCIMMPSSRDLLLLFIALELVSAPGFLMAAFRKRDPKSNEAGLKFFLIGVLSTAVMLYGMSMIYGLTGSTRLDAIAQALADIGTAQETLAFSAILFVVIGFAFKVAAVPFQFWAPDTYEGAPVPVAAFLAVASSAAGFAGLLQLMFVAFIHQYEFWAPIFAALSIATMTLGNLVALKQTQVVRLLAYSGIAQAGYMLLPFALVSGDVAVNHQAFSASVTYILIYGIMM
jgi:NADH-quinone oxidoreductase subunit N